MSTVHLSLVTQDPTLHWLSFLNEVGTPELSISADTNLYAVFKNRME